MPKGNNAVSFGARLGWKEKHQDISFNYTRITQLGRYLMPREWGRDPFFTFCRAKEMKVLEISMHGCYNTKNNLEKVGFSYIQV